MSPRAARTGVLVLALLQLAGPAVFTRFSPNDLGSGATVEAAVTPAGYAFSIWGLITALCTVVAAYITLRGMGVDREGLALARLGVTFAGFNVWLVLAAFDLLWGTVVVFALMLVALLGLIVQLARSPVDRPAWFGWLLRGTVGLYAGWVTVAWFVNVAAALIDSGVDLDTTVGTNVQLLLIVGAVTVAVLALRASRGSLGYTAGVLWALVAAAIGASTASTLLSAAAVAAILLVVTAALLVRLRGPAPA